MERLQNALHRARETRTQTGSGASLKGPVKKSGTIQRPSATPAEAEIAARWANLPAFQPNSRALQSGRIVSFFGKQHATPFDMMRTKVVQQAKANNWRRIVVTSPTPRCGKTTIATNLAFSLSRQSEMRIIVVELDLRRPSMAKILGLKQPQYFAKALAGLEKPEDHMVRFGDNLAFCTNLAAASNPSELLQSAKTQKILDELEETYQPDLMIFDTAPVLASDDTIGFMEHVDAALLVAAAEMTSIKEVDIAESEISEVTQIMGIVLNKCRYPTGGYGYEYEYGY